MTLPPSLPCKIQNELGVFEDVTYFDFFIKLVKEDAKGKNLDINYNGLSKIKEEYIRIDKNDKEALWRLTNSLNMWCDFFYDLSDIANKLALNANTEKIRQIAVSSIAYDGKNSTNGKRGADMDELVVNARNVRNSFEAMQKAFENKARFFERAFYICKDMLKESNI